MKKPKPIRTLAQAERWCRRKGFNLVLSTWKDWRERWVAGRILLHSAVFDKYNPPPCYAPTPWEAVEKLRRKLESKPHTTGGPIE